MSLQYNRIVRILLAVLIPFLMLDSIFDQNTFSTFKDISEKSGEILSDTQDMNPEVLNFVTTMFIPFVKTFLVVPMFLFFWIKLFLIRTHEISLPPPRFN
jgi:hypothetical protein